MQRTYTRNPVWSSTMRLFEAHAHIVPNSVRMNHGLASEHGNAGNHSGAVVYYRKAIKYVCVFV